MTEKIPVFAGDDAIRVHALRDYLRRAGAHAQIPHRHAFWQILVFVEGGGHHDIDFVRHEVSDGMLAVIPEGAVHAFVPSAFSVDGFLIHFPAALFLESARDKHALMAARVSGSIAPTSSPLRSDFDSVVSLVKWVHEGQGAIERNSTLKRLALQTVLQVFLDGAPKLLGGNELLEFVALVEAHFADRLPIHGYAEKMRMSEKQLYRLIKAALGTSPRKFVDGRALLEAKRHLVHSDEGVAAVGYSLGYDDPAYFSRFFRNNTGESPRAFRRRKQLTPL